MSKYIVDGIEISSDSDREHSDEKNSAEKILIKKILMKRIKNTHIVKLIFKACKKTYFYNFFCLYKNVNNILSKQLRKVFKKGSGTVPKLFWRRKNKNLEYGHERYKTFLKDKKQRG